MTIQKRYTLMLDAMSLTQLQAEMRHDDWRAPLARKAFAEQLLAIRLDTLLGYDEPGWHSVSPLYGAIEFHGSLPDGLRQKPSERVLQAADRMRQMTRAETLATQLIDRLPVRQRLALLVDGLRQRYQMTRAAACQVESWAKLAGQLQLSRWLTPQQMKPMSPQQMGVSVGQARQRLSDELELHQAA